MKMVNICFLKQGLLKTTIPDLEGEDLLEHCENLLNEASDADIDAALADTDPIWDGTYRYGKYDADAFLIGKVEEAETSNPIFQTKTWEYLGDESAIDNLELENKAMGDFLEKQVGFSKDNVSDIANGSTKLYAVHVVCDNTLQSYRQYTKLEDAHAAYITLCEKWYRREGVEAFRHATEYDSEIEFWNGYYNSPEYHDECDYAHVTLEVLNA